MDGLTNGKIGGKKKCLAGHEKGYYNNDVLKRIEGESIAHITDA